MLPGTPTRSYVTDMNILRYSMLLLLSLAMLTESSMADSKKPRIEDIKYHTAEAGEQITFSLTAPSPPTVFTLPGDNPRIVFDFAGATTSRNIASLIPVQGKLVQRIRVGLHHGDKPKVRVVLDLATQEMLAVKQSYNKEASVLTVTLSPKHSLVKPQKTKAAVTTASTTAPASQEEPASSPQSTKDSNQARLTSISFDDSTNKGEMVLFQLNGFYPPSVQGVEDDTPRAICDFEKTIMAPNVTGIEKTGGQWVKSIRLGQDTDPGQIRVLIDLVPHKSYDLQQVFFKEDNLFVIIVNLQDTFQPQEATN
ncbi:MAG: hypothetical protein CSA33_08295 [Desulfobulbus propionicus]|nr:MAG: hypothetical protein CSA33_08295 [Desulfobulbus propionicus]